MSLVDRADKLIIAHAQFLLKIEWEKVKYEARGWCYRIWHRNYEKELIDEYVRFVSSEGEIETIRSEFDTLRLERANLRASSAPRAADR